MYGTFEKYQTSLKFKAVLNCFKVCDAYQGKKKILYGIFRQMSRGQFLALKMRVLAYYRLIS